MKDFIERYQVKLKTIGPVHIGSGETLRKNEWILDYRSNNAIVVDFSKFVDFLMKRKLLDDYEANLMAPRPTPLFKWLNDHDIHKNEMDAFTSYSLDISGLNLKNKQIKDMQLIMKDPYGLPYIPGSTLKGAIRNVLLAAKLSEEGYDNRSIIGEIRSYSGKERYFLERERKTLETTIFHTKNLYEKRQHAINDTMSGIRISDSASVSLAHLTLCQKIDVNVQGKENELPTVRECIRPGTIFESELTIDRTETDITIDEIRASICSFLQDYNDMFLSGFPDEELYHGDILYLGGGAGFPTKTVLNQVVRREKDRVRLVATAIDKSLPRNMRRHSKDHIKGVSPTVAKLTEIDGMLLQMGPCKLDFYKV